MSASEIQQALRKLNTCASVLYVAAHPDDENTALIAYLASARLARTGYLSLTRGDGGQNLIGTEQGPALGLIRTQELLAARRLDGGEQFFTRAVDFGYSKTPDESLAIWDHDSVLADVVWVVRLFRPDVIITRFPDDGRGGHGHHTASALLAQEAFTAAADPRRFPEQLRHVSPWQTRRLFWNVWQPEDTTGLLTVDVGEYNPLRGTSYTEVAAASRSMHQSQGFGAAARRGSRPEYLQQLAGDPAREDPFEGIVTNWSRVPGGERVGQWLHRAYAEFRPEDPARSLPTLLQAYRALQRLESAHWREAKRTELAGVIAACAGLHLSARAPQAFAAPGDTLRIRATAVQRSSFPITWRGVSWGGLPEVLDQPLAANQPTDTAHVLTVPAVRTTPFWMAQPPAVMPGQSAAGRFPAADPTQRHQPQTDGPLTVTFVLTFEDVEISFVRNVQYQWVDPVRGELFRRVAVAPPVTLDFAEATYLFADTATQLVEVWVRTHRDSVCGKVTLPMPRGWRVSPARAHFRASADGPPTVLTFRVQPPATPSRARLTLQAITDAGEVVTQTERVVEHPHIPPQAFYPPATATLVRTDLQTGGRRIAYVAGPGDEVAASLRRAGYTVTVLDARQLGETDLSAFDAVVTGIRAFNRETALRTYRTRLMDYVADGGTLVVQYNTNRGLVTDELGPYPFKLSRQRVTEETAPVRMLVPDHPLLTHPNQITAADFEGWVQERGLYFAEEWDERYAPLLSSHDAGEDPQAGGLLHARHGRGAFVYTGLAFFRQLPAGVPGAYRLFANLLAGGQEPPLARPE